MRGGEHGGQEIGVGGDPPSLPGILSRADCWRSPCCNGRVSQSGSVLHSLYWWGRRRWDRTGWNRLKSMAASTVADVEYQHRPWRLGVLVSGSGRTLVNLLRVIDNGDLHARIVSVVSSRSGVRALDHARAAGIPPAVVPRSAHPDLPAFSSATLETLEASRPDLVIMAGYLRKVLVLPGWEGRILNIHPALLPEAAAYAAGRGLYGDSVHSAVLDHGDRVSGATVHVVTDEYDTGPPLARVEVPVIGGDTVASLGARVFAAECALYPEAIRTYCRSHPGLRRRR